jgi:hypothetical protein
LVQKATNWGGEIAKATNLGEFSPKLVAFE